MRVTADRGQGINKQLGTGHAPWYVGRFKRNQHCQKFYCHILPSKQEDQCRV